MRNCSLRVSATLVMFVCALGAHAGGRGSEICRVETRVVSTSIPFNVHYEFSRLVGPGRCIKARNGKDGSITKTYNVYFVDGHPIGKALAYTEKTPPVDAIYQMGRSGFETSRGSFHRSKILTMNASGYDPSPATIGRGATGMTATGRHADYGCVAVDPRVIPLNTLVFVEGYGFALACDKGSAIRGNRIDLCFKSRSQAIRFGRKQVKVHIFSDR
jgi:3D (Asp-Asp-Asp) domain-containing protein